MGLSRRDGWWHAEGETSCASLPFSPEIFCCSGNVGTSRCVPLFHGGNVAVFFIVVVVLVVIIIALIIRRRGLHAEIPLRSFISFLSLLFPPGEEEGVGNITSPGLPSTSAFYLAKFHFIAPVPSNWLSSVVASFYALVQLCLQLFSLFLFLVNNELGKRMRLKNFSLVFFSFVVFRRISFEAKTGQSGLKRKYQNGRKTEWRTYCQNGWAMAMMIGGEGSLTDDPKGKRSRKDLATLRDTLWYQKRHLDE